MPRGEGTELMEQAQPKGHHYDATNMPDLYKGTRQIFMRTNDPTLPEVEFVIQVDET